MAAITHSTFVHPQEAFRVNYPSHWEHRVEDDGKSCGFGPRDRDNVGLWISIMPASIDTDRIVDDLPTLMEKALEKVAAGGMRRDPTIRHYALKADMHAADQGGNYWIVAGGDLILFASSQVPPDQREQWNPPFERIMSSLEITRDDALQQRKVAVELIERLHKLHPEQEYQFDEHGIKGRDHAVFLSNLYRQVAAAPQRKSRIIDDFIAGLTQPAGNMGWEELEEVRRKILPVLKPKDYVEREGPTQHIYTTEWLADVFICYVIKDKKIFRFITGWDLRRWEFEADDLHKLALDNLCALPWPHGMHGARDPAGGRVILVETGDSISSSRLLHPELHHLLSGPLGSPFWAGVPNRDTLVTFSDRRALKQRIGRQLKKDCNSSAYSITPRPFLVTADGVAPGLEQ